MPCRSAGDIGIDVIRLPPAPTLEDTSCQPVVGSSCKGTESRTSDWSLSASPWPVSRATSALVLEALEGVLE